MAMKKKKKLKKKDRLPKLGVTFSATDDVIQTAREVADKVYNELTDYGNEELVLNPGDEEIRKLWVALDVYDSDDSGLYKPFDPPEITYPRLRLSEVADQLGVGVEKMRIWLRDETEFQKVTGVWLFDQEMIEAAYQRFPQQPPEDA